jgi:hypothetical protein
VDFRNSTDFKHLWWQELQRGAVFRAKRYVYHEAIDPISFNCISQNYNFYLVVRGRYTAITVDMSRGVGMQRAYQPNTLYFCVRDDPGMTLETDVVVQAVLTFIYCINNYGTGIQLK